MGYTLLKCFISRRHRARQTVNFPFGWFVVFGGLFLFITRSSVCLVGNQRQFVLSCGNIKLKHGFY